VVTLVTASARGKEIFNDEEQQSVLIQRSHAEVGRSDLSSKHTLASNPVHLLSAAVNQRIKPEVL
jgi:hypothetical protein